MKQTEKLAAAALLVKAAGNYDLNRITADNRFDFTPTLTAKPFENQAPLVPSMSISPDYFTAKNLSFRGIDRLSEPDRLYFTERAGIVSGWRPTGTPGLYIAPNGTYVTPNPNDLNYVTGHNFSNLAENMPGPGSAGKWFYAGVGGAAVARSMMNRRLDENTRKQYEAAQKEAERRNMMAFGDPSGHRAWYKKPFDWIHNGWQHMRGRRTKYEVWQRRQQRKNEALKARTNDIISRLPYEQAYGVGGMADEYLENQRKKNAPPKPAAPQTPISRTYARPAAGHGMGGMPFH